MSAEDNKLQGDWNYPTSVYFGVGRISRLPETCRSLNISHPLLVTDTGLLTQDFILKSLETNAEAGLECRLFSKVKSNPTGKNIDEGVNAYHEAGCDGVIAMGGGSALDAGKAIALMVGQDRPIWDFEDVGENWLRVKPEAIAPTIAIPTTAGTGSEVGRAAVILDTSCQIKKIIFHPKMLPEVVIADPALTRSLPAHLTAATGLDAFVHLLEAYCTPGFHPMAEGIALEGMRLVKENLLRAFEAGQDLSARAYMMSASLMGAVAFQKGLGAVHALAHPLGAVFDKHHGLLNAILLPYVLRRNRPAIEKKMKRAAIYIGLSDASFEVFYDWILSLRKTLQIPETLQDIGITASERDRIGQMAFDDPSASGNPISFTAEDYAAIFENAVMGKGL
ncbi:MAG: iron-containing alcohol dehydrogenase [Nitrospirae bacterium]|nr:iron-containing alcohol dehydrogenase [Candidatus Manganitrophaceae bacterium]